MSKKDSSLMLIELFRETKQDAIRKTVMITKVNAITIHFKGRKYEYSNFQFKFKYLQLNNI